MVGIKYILIYQIYGNLETWHIQVTQRTNLFSTIIVQ